MADLGEGVMWGKELVAVCASVKEMEGLGLRGMGVSVYYFLSFSCIDVGFNRSTFRWQSLARPWPISGSIHLSHPFVDDRVS